MLEGISMVWNAQKYRWDTMYGFAREYYLSHGDLKIPKGTLAENGSDLFSWTQEQMRNYKKGKLDDEHIPILGCAPFWTSSTDGDAIYRIQHRPLGVAVAEQDVCKVCRHAPLRA